MQSAHEEPSDDPEHLLASGAQQTLAMIVCDTSLWYSPDKFWMACKVQVVLIVVDCRLAQELM